VVAAGSGTTIPAWLIATIRPPTVIELFRSAPTFGATAY
jgi:hypothetical protein